MLVHASVFVYGPCTECNTSSMVTMVFHSTLMLRRLIPSINSVLIPKSQKCIVKHSSPSVKKRVVHSSPLSCNDRYVGQASLGSSLFTRQKYYLAYLSDEIPRFLEKHLNCVVAIQRSKKLCLYGAIVRDIKRGL